LLRDRLHVTVTMDRSGVVLGLGLINNDPWFLGVLRLSSSGVFLVARLS
jgi:hypothetical protein